VTWLDHVTSDNTVNGTPGRVFTFNAAHEALTNITTNGGLAGIVSGLGVAVGVPAGTLDGFEFNSLP
jgi:hypothetical protein